MNDLSPADTTSSQPALSPTDPQTNDLLATQKLLRATLDSSMDMIQVFKAVRNQQGEIIDFIWLLNNHAAQKIYGNVVGKSLLQLQPGVVEEGIFASLKQVVDTSLPQQYEKHYVHEQFDGWFHQSLVKLNDGVVTTTADITTRKQAEQQLQQSRSFLQSVIDSSLDVIQVFKAVRDETGAILDFVWVMNNQKAVAQNGEVIGQSLLKLNPGVVATGIFEHMVEVAQTGVAYEQEQYYPHEQFDGWFYQALVKTDDGVAMTTRDISRQKQAEQEVLRLKDEVAQRATDKYESIFNSIDDGLAIVEVFPDHHGRVTDVIWREANAGVERNAGISGWVGKRASQIVPHLEQAWLDAMTSVYQTGEPVRMEAYIVDLDRWISTFYGRIGGQGSRLITSVFRDITDRKQQQQRQEFLLQLGDILRTHLTDTAAMQTAALTLLAEQFDVIRAIYYEGEPDQDTFTLTARFERDASPIPDPLRLSNFSPTVADEYRSGRTQLVTDTENEPFPEAYRAIGIRAWLAVPFVKDGRLVTVVGVHAKTPRNWTAIEVQLVEEFAERTWAAVERAKTEAALRASQQRFASVANLVPDLLWDSKPGGATNWYNNRWLEYTGQTFEEAIGWGWTDAIHPDDRTDSVKRYHEAVLAGQPVRLEQRIRRYDGVYRWFVVNASPLNDEQGRVVMMYGAATDIHESKLLEATLQQADQRKDEFLAMLAHELRNPLSTIRSGLQILRLVDANDDLSSNTVEMMNRQTDHLARMLDDLLDVSRISRGKIELHKERVNLVELVQQAVASCQSLFAQGGKTLHLNAPEAPVELDGDPTRLTQIVINLLTNSARYTGDRGRVWLSLEHKAGPLGGHEAIFQVRDNGIGLTTDQLSVIFELFVQVDTSTARSRGGLGLGLTLVKRLTELHGGRVEAQSEGLGKGSIITVHLPTLTPVAELSPQPALQATDSARAGRILVIDDNEDAAFTLAMLLKIKGYEAHTRHSGRAGIEAAESLQPSVILLDIGMPGMDGYETCRTIRQQAWGEGMVVIALTGYGQQEDRQRTREAGFDGHLVKPVDLTVLLNLLTDLLDKGKNLLE